MNIFSIRDNSLKADVIVGKDSKRKFTLQQDDSFTLKFSLLETIHFELGDYVFFEGNKYEIVDDVMPNYNTKNGGYDYSITFKAEYFKWKNKIIKYTPEVGGQEAEFTLTAPIGEHMEVFLKNLEYINKRTVGGHGYDKHNEDGTTSPYCYVVDGSVEQKSCNITYSNVNMFDALGLLADAWECEWWVAGNTIHFGKVAYDYMTIDPLTFALNDNVVSMKRNGNKTAATRIYPFGSTKNIPPTYRHHLIFDIKELQNVSGKGYVFKDTARPINDDSYFDGTSAADLYTLSENVGCSASTTAYSDWQNITLSSIDLTLDKYSTLPLTIGNANPIAFYFTEVRMQIMNLWHYCTVTGAEVELLLRKFKSGELVSEIALDSKKYTDVAKTKISGDDYKMTFDFPFANKSYTYDVEGEITNVKFVVRVRPISGEYETDLYGVPTMGGLAYNLNYDLGVKIGAVEPLSLNITETRKRKSFTTKVHFVERSENADGVMYYKEFAEADVVLNEEGDYDHINEFTVKQAYLVNGNTKTPVDFNNANVRKGTYFKVDGIKEWKLPAYYMTADSVLYGVNDEYILNGIAQRNLMLPNGEGTKTYLVTKEGLPEEQYVEQVVVFDDIYPRTRSTVSNTYIETRKNVENEDTGDKVDVRLFHFTANWQGVVGCDEWGNELYDEIGKIKFKKDYILEGTDSLKITFTSGLLNGMEFSVNFRNSNEAIDAVNGVKPSTGDNTVWEIVRNDSYGQMLPNDTLRPYSAAEHEARQDGFFVMKDGQKVYQGDTFVLTGWNTASISEMNLVEYAEKELLAKAKIWLNDKMKDPNTYDCTLMCDEAYKQMNAFSAYHTLAAMYPLGKRVKLVNPTFFGEENERITHIIGYEYNLDYPYDNPTITLGETPTSSRLGSIEGKINAIVKGASPIYGGYGNGSGGSTVYLIKLGDKTEALDSNTFSALRIQADFLRRNVENSATEKVTFEKGIGIGGNHGINENGDAILNDVKLNNANMVKTTTREVVSPNFEYGSLGYGFRLAQEEGMSSLELDNLFVRNKMVVNTLEVNKETHTGGNQLLSCAGNSIKDIEYIPNVDNPIAFKCYLDLEDSDGNKKENMWDVGDQALCKTFNYHGLGYGENVSTHYFWRLVTEIGEDEKGGYIVLSNQKAFTLSYEGKSYQVRGYQSGLNTTDEDNQYPYDDKEERGNWMDSDYPMVGDDIVQLGNQINTLRQHAIEHVIYGSKAPAILEYKGINKFSLEGRIKTQISPTAGNKFYGSFTIDNNGDGKNYELKVEIADREYFYMLTEELEAPKENSVLWKKALQTPTRYEPFLWKKTTYHYSDGDKSVVEYCAQYIAGADGYTYRNVDEEFGNSLYNGTNSTESVFDETFDFTFGSAPIDIEWGVEPENGKYRWRRYRVQTIQGDELITTSTYFYECVGYVGANGAVTYTWIKYADSVQANGYPTNGSFYDTPKSTTKYIGIAYNKTTLEEESTDATIYKWSEFVGDDGQGMVKSLIFCVSNDKPTEISATYGSFSTPSPTSGYWESYKSTQTQENASLYPLDFTVTKGSDSKSGISGMQMYQYSVSNIDLSAALWCSTALQKGNYGLLMYSSGSRDFAITNTNGGNFPKYTTIKLRLKCDEGGIDNTIENSNISYTTKTPIKTSVLEVEYTAPFEYALYLKLHRNTYIQAITITYETRTYFRWYDGVPTNNDKLPIWVSSRIFTSDGKSPQQSSWSTPTMMADSTDIDYCYSSKENPSDPPSDDSQSQETEDWHNVSTEYDIWMAVRKKSKGSWGEWSISKIKGEKGEDGYTYENAEESFGTASFGALDATHTVEQITWNDTVVLSSYRWRRYKIKKMKGDTLVETSDYKYECVGYIGSDGRSSHIWVKYATDINGSNMTDTPNDNTSYIGFAYNKEKSEAEDTASNDPKSYTWRKYIGDNGVSVSSINVYYAIGDNNVTAPNDSAFTYDTYSQVPQNSTNANKYLWECSKITYSDSSSVYVGKICDGLIKDLAQATEEYGLSDSNTATPTVWATTYTAVEDKWLWVRTHFVGTNGAEWYSGHRCIDHFPKNGINGIGSYSISLSNEMGAIGIDPETKIALDNSKSYKTLVEVRYGTESLEPSSLGAYGKFLYIINDGDDEWTCEVNDGIIDSIITRPHYETPLNGVKCIELEFVFNNDADNNKAVHNSGETLDIPIVATVATDDESEDTLTKTATVLFSAGGAKGDDAIVPSIVTNDTTIAYNPNTKTYGTSLLVTKVIYTKGESAVELDTKAKLAAKNLALTAYNGAAATTLSDNLEINIANIKPTDFILLELKDTDGVLRDKQTINIVNDGTAGTNGFSVIATEEAYGNGSSADSHADVTFNNAAVVKGKYRWRRFRTKLSDGTTEKYNPTNGYYYECIGYLGDDGKSLHTWIKYADKMPTSNTDIYNTPKDTTTYIGMAYNKAEDTESVNYTDYTWKRYVGENGIGIASADVVYSLSTSNTTEPSDNQFTITSFSNIAQNKDNANKYLWECTKVSYTSGNPSYVGKICDGLMSQFAAIEEQYGLSDSQSTEPTSWNTSYTAVEDKWLWTRTKFTGTSGNVWFSNARCVDHFAKNGENGRGELSRVYYYTLTANSTDTPDFSGRLTVSPPTTDDYKYLWRKTIITYNKAVDGKISEEFVELIGIHGSKGVDGDADDYIYWRTNTMSTSNAPAFPTPPISSNGADGTWRDDPMGVDKDHRYEYVAVAHKRNGVWGAYGEIALYSYFSQDGTDGKGVNPNLLLDTIFENPRKSWGIGSSSFGKTTYGGYNAIIFTDRWVDADLMYQDVRLDPSKTYTLSFYGKSYNNSTIRVYCDNGDDNCLDEDDSLDTTWTLREWSFQPASDYCRITFQALEGDEDNLSEYEICMIKLEEGDTATAYLPHSNDLKGAAGENGANGIGSFVVDFSNLSGTIGLNGSTKKPIDGNSTYKTDITCRYGTAVIQPTNVVLTVTDVSGVANEITVGTPDEYGDVEDATEYSLSYVYDTDKGCLSIELTIKQTTKTYISGDRYSVAFKGTMTYGTYSSTIEKVVDIILTAGGANGESTRSLAIVSNNITALTPLLSSMDSATDWFMLSEGGAQCVISGYKGNTKAAASITSVTVNGVAYTTISNQEPIGVLSGNNTSAVAFTLKQIPNSGNGYDVKNENSDQKTKWYIPVTGGEIVFTGKVDGVDCTLTIPYTVDFSAKFGEFENTNEQFRNRLTQSEAKNGELEEKYSEIKQTATNIALKVGSKSNARNLIPNSKLGGVKGSRTVFNKGGFNGKYLLLSAKVNGTAANKHTSGSYSKVYLWRYITGESGAWSSNQVSLNFQGVTTSATKSALLLVDSDKDYKVTVCGVSEETELDYEWVMLEDVTELYLKLLAENKVAPTADELFTGWSDYDVENGLRDTGIDIESGMIVLTSNNVVFRNQEDNSVNENMTTLIKGGSLTTNQVISRDKDGNICSTMNIFGQGEYIQWNTCDIDAVFPSGTNAENMEARYEALVDEGEFSSGVLYEDFVKTVNWEKRTYATKITEFNNGEIFFYNNEHNIPSDVISVQDPRSIAEWDASARFYISGANMASNKVLKMKDGSNITSSTYPYSWKTKNFSELQAFGRRQLYQFIYNGVYELLRMKNGMFFQGFNYQGEFVNMEGIVVVESDFPPYFLTETDTQSQYNGCYYIEGYYIKNGMRTVYGNDDTEYSGTDAEGMRMRFYFDNNGSNNGCFIGSEIKTN